MSEPWTPGPWNVEKDTGKEEFYGWWMYAGPAYLLAADGGDNPEWHKVEADARLIAAAPEMAELLERLSHRPDGNAYFPPTRDEEDAHALLARIRGEA